MNKDGYILKGEVLYKYKKVPQKILDQFNPKNIKFLVDEFEEITLRDIYRYDQTTLEKINRDVTTIFKKWIVNKIEKKENISINAKGTTRSGKSLSLLAIGETIGSLNNKEFNTEKIICANQKEYRQKLKEAEFGDYYQIDENAFNNVGLGSMSEIMQLKDIQNIIAKQNINTAYITPRRFLETNAILGLSSWGKDSKNWISRFLLYDLRSAIMPLLGYVVIDVGKLFYKYGCLIFKELGGCTNPNKLKVNNLNPENIKYTSCLKENYNENELIETGKQCPFYNVCQHPLNAYEKKKDKWIEREMKGGIDERTEDRYITAVKLLEKLGEYDQSTSSIILKARDSKNLKVKIRIMISEISNTVYTNTEIDEILVILKGFTGSTEFLESVCKKVELNFKDVLNNLPFKNETL